MTEHIMIMMIVGRRTIMAGMEVEKEENTHDTIIIIIIIQRQLTESAGGALHEGGGQALVEPKDAPLTVQRPGGGGRARGQFTAWTPTEHMQGPLVLFGALLRTRDGRC
jgi:hypothetical protein